MLFWTTLRRLRTHARDYGCYAKLRDSLGAGYGDYTPIDILTILTVVGLRAAVYELVRDRDDQPERGQARKLLAIMFAEHVLPLYEQRYSEDIRPRQAMETACLATFGLATAEELKDSLLCVQALCRETDGAGWAAAGAALWAVQGNTALAMDSAVLVATAGKTSDAKQEAQDAERAWQIGAFLRVIIWLEKQKRGLP